MPNKLAVPDQRRRYVRPGEMLAMDPRWLSRGPEGFFWMSGSGHKPNERYGNMAVVHIRGELDHHAEDGWGESYENILAKYKQVLSGDTDGDDDADDVKGPPGVVCFCIDSPGGVVSGLNETIKAIGKMRREAGIPLIAYVNEMAASAAYAIACSCDLIYCPPSAIVGSIGVISTMISQVRKNQKDGYDVRLITSGARKADGHLLAPISDDAIAAERVRVDKLADEFFAVVKSSRGLSLRKIRGLEAGIFLGLDAKRVGLADRVLSWSATIDMHGGVKTNENEQEGGNETDRREAEARGKRTAVCSAGSKSTLTGSGSTHTTDVGSPSMDLDKLIAKFEAKLHAAIGSGKADRIASVAASLAAARQAKKDSEEDEEEDDEEEKSKKAAKAGTAADEKEDDEEEKSKKAAKAGAAAADRMLAAKKKVAATPEKDNDEDDSEEKKTSKAILAAVQEITGANGVEALGALRAIASLSQRHTEQIAALEKDKRVNAKASLINGALGSHVTPSEAEWLETQPLAVVKGFVEHRHKTGVIVHTDEGTLLRPAAPAGTEASLPKEVRAIIDEAVVAFPGGKAEKDAYRATLVTAQVNAANESRMNLNGGGRY